MQTVDHKMIAKKAISGMGGISHIRRIAFVFGSIEPDINMLTFLRGAVKNRKIVGHKYENIIPVMKRLFLSFCKKDQLSLADYYKLGKLLHYMADSFTFPHNQTFTGSVRDHFIYEYRFHRKIINELDKKIISAPIESFFDFENFERLHEEYLRNAGEMDTDFLYVLITAQIMAEYIFTLQNNCYYMQDAIMKAKVGLRVF